MPKLRELYPDVILEYNKRPHNFYVMEAANGEAEGYSPLCGDKLTLYLKVHDNIICNASFQGSGCAISQASASLLTDVVKGKTVHEAEDLFDRLQQMLGSPNSTPLPDGLGELSVLASIRRFPARVDCACLAWQILLAALKSVEHA